MICDMCHFKSLIKIIHHNSEILNSEGRNPAKIQGGVGLSVTIFLAKNTEAKKDFHYNPLRTDAKPLNKIRSLGSCPHELKSAPINELKITLLGSWGHEPRHQKNHTSK